MDGLEAVELKLSEVEDGVRIDAELYQKHFVQFLHHLKNLKTTTLQIEADIVKKGIFDIKASSYNLRGIPFVRIGNLKNMLIDTSDIIYIPESENKKNIDTFLKRDDIILSKTANAAASLVNIECCNTSQDTVAIKLKPDSQLLSHFIVVYLNTISGLKEMQRWFTGNIQMHLNLTDCKTKMMIPVFEKHFQSAIKTLFEKSINKNEETISKYKQAESLLLNELRLHNWQPTQANTEVKRVKNSFLQSGRLDAEYYQPKYDVLTEKIQQAEHYKLNELVKIKKSIEPGSAAYVEEGIPFIRVANLSKLGLSEPDIFLRSNHIDEIEKLYPKKDTILLSKDGSVGIAYKVEEDMKAITSGAILHLMVNNEKIIPDYLTLVLNSILVQLQAERDAGGSIIQHWRKDEIEKVLIPVIAIEKQQQIAKLIQQSFSLKKQSEQLLQTAKQAVEIAIEEGEEKAMEFIKKFLKTVAND